MTQRSRISGSPDQTVGFDQDGDIEDQDKAEWKN
jgi:hypothetical protein